MHTTAVETTRWHGCYDAGWRDLIVPDAFAHPAKMSRALVARIFDELFARGALSRGAVVVDPFGGIGTTAIEGTSRGMQVVCCELEPKFVGLATANFELHARVWEAMGRPRPRIVNGDSRKLREHVGPVLAECVVSSPPYAGNDKKDNTLHDRDPRAERFTGAFRGSYGTSDGQLGAMASGDVDAVIASPPYIGGGHHPDQTGAWNTNGLGMNKGGTSLGSKEMAGEVDAVISSPPYAEIASGCGGLNTKPAKDGQQGGRSASSPSQDTDSRYGETPGQLARMPKGEVDAIVSSPPFTQGYSGGGGINVKGYGADGKDKVGARTYQGTGNERTDGNLETMPLGEVADALVSSPPYMGEAVTERNGIDTTKFAPGVKSGGPNSQARAGGYGDTEGQLGGLRDEETFWSAALDIVRESYAVLKPGGTAVWVVKAFVRDKQLVDFPGDWRKLCESVGFETVTEVHAMLVAEETKNDLFDGPTVKRRERKSFFRRLAEKKGSPRIDWETVYFMRKPS